MPNFMLNAKYGFTHLSRLQSTPNSHEQMANLLQLGRKVPEMNVVLLDATESFLSFKLFSLRTAKMH